MGCCSSAEASTDNDGLTFRPSNLRGGNKPLKRKGIRWTADSPITTAELQRQRDTFWDTAPSYEGRPEVWQAIHAAVSESDLALAQSILDAAGVTLPTGNPADGCYDELGSRYVVPMYCLVDPTNLSSGGVDPVTDMASTSTSLYTHIPYSPPQTNDDNSVVHSVVSSNTEEKSNIDSGSYPITIRLSTSLDINIKIATDGSETIGKLRLRLMAHPNLAFARDSHYLKFIYLGRILDDQVKLYDDDANVQNDRNNAKIAKEGVLQALVARK
ncbi:hypothetical protein BC943DRAFT_316774 [Umbelopsis sp. AD052]|nr:hypothetical protein BC943DRAFT_316774 [Umbelopsis sp. AD052]